MNQTKKAMNMRRKLRQPKKTCVELRYIAYLLGLHVLLLFSSVEANLDAFRGLEHDIAAEHRKFLLPALNPLVRLQNPYYGVRHLSQREILACEMTLEHRLSILSLGDAVIGCTHQCICEDHH